MPCQYYSAGEQESLLRRDFKVAESEKTRLQCLNDRYRDIILAAQEAGFVEGVSPTELQKIKEDQIAHRKAELKRLAVVFKREKDATKLGKVILADPTKPLRPQLGFDPDGF